MARSRLPFLLAALMAATAFAGCFAGEPSDDGAPQAGAKPKPPTSEVTLAPPADAEVKTGDLEVKVRDDAGAAFPGATVTVVPSTTSAAVEVPPALTNADGVALFKGLPAQGYRVEAQAEGFETAVQGASIVAGQTAKLDLKLKRIIAEQAYNVTVSFTGRVTCSAGMAVLVTCAQVRDATKTAGYEHASEFSWTYGNAGDPPVDDKVVEVWVEAKWTRLTPAAVSSMGKLVLFDPSNRNSNAVSTSGVEASAHPPGRVGANAQALAGWGLDKGGTLGFELQPANTFTSPGYAVNWQFTAWATVFYNGPADPCYSPALQKVVLTDPCKAARAAMQP